MDSDSRKLNDTSCKLEQEYPSKLETVHQRILFVLNNQSKPTFRIDFNILPLFKCPPAPLLCRRIRGGLWSLPVPRV